jgi:hypothetical protein
MPWNRALVRYGPTILAALATDQWRCQGPSAPTYLEVAEHDPGEARRRAAVKARRFVGFAAVVAVTLPPAPR